MSAQAVNARTLNAATRVLFGIASTSAPAGTWLAIAAIVPMLSARPIEVCVQLWMMRYTAMKGPKPVWILATNRLNQSSPRPAASDDPAGCGFAGGGDSARTAIHSLLAFRGIRCGCRGGRLRSGGGLQRGARRRRRRRLRRHQ